MALTAAGIPFTQHVYEHDPAARSFGLEAAEVLGLPPEQVFKTLLVDTGAGLAVAVVPVAGQPDLKAMAAALGAKRVSMADPAAAQRSWRDVVGGISPIGQKRTLPTVVDESAELFDVAQCVRRVPAPRPRASPTLILWRVTGAVVADMAAQKPAFNRTVVVGRQRIFAHVGQPGRRCRCRCGPRSTWASPAPPAGRPA